MTEQNAFGEWLAATLEERHLSYRGAGDMLGLSHSALRHIVAGVCPNLETFRKIVDVFGGAGPEEKLWLEDHLLVLLGYKTMRPGQEPSQSMAQLQDSLSQLNEPQVKMMTLFADFLMVCVDLKDPLGRP